jgi:hypothetical protein
MKPTLRLLTILCYFLPFTFFMTTCNKFELYEAYNKKDAEKNRLRAEQADQSNNDTSTSDTAKKSANTVVDTAHATISATKDSADTIKNNATVTTNKDSFWEKAEMIMIMPTSSSLSGIGSALFYKNFSGQVFIGLSFLLSLLLLFPWKFLKKKNARWYFLLADFICVLAFITDSFISEVTVLFGSWVLLALIAIQLAIAEREGRKKTSP